MVIVIGGGIGGLTAAIALQRAGRDVQVFERTPEWRELGAGLSLWRNALVALDSLGLGHAVRALGAPYPGAALRTWDGRVLVAPAMEKLVARVGELGVVVHRAALQQLLVEAVGPGRIHLNKACTAIAQTGDRVTAAFADGTTVDGDALIGADGLHSVVRASLFGSVPPRYSGYTAWRGVVRFDPAQLAIGESWGRGERFGQAPMADGLVYWFATQDAAPNQRAAGGEKAGLLRIFGHWHAPTRALIEATPEAMILRNDIYDRPALRTWSRGRVTLLGDAAHPMTPNLGQGGCQAIEDAVVLARAMREQSDLAAAFRTYERARLRRTRIVTSASRRIGDMGQWSNPAAVWFRTRLVRALGFLQVGQLARVIGYDADRA